MAASHAAAVSKNGNGWIVTINDFILEIDKLRDRLDGTEQLTVAASGGLGGYGKPIESLSLGFDWDKGKIILHPKFPLMLSPKQRKQEKE